ncbi:hypothetical protein B0H13DRAFT_2667116 [Mycena leptocephala]|nr:hypothetical protein B0H13DRAFT_2667116 [Mycena leptocephala]
MKTELSSYSGPFGGDRPQSMTKPINGSALTTTLGWEYRQGATDAILIPSTFVAVASVVIVLLAQVLNQGIPARHAHFDPTDPLVIMAAASAGGMDEMFNGLAKEDIKDGGVSPPASTLAAPSQRGNSLWVSPAHGNMMERHPSSQRFPSEDMKSDFRAIDAVPEKSTRWVMGSYESRWPLSVVVGQLFLLALFLGFFGASNPQSKTAILTLLASVLSAYSSYLVIRNTAIQYAVRVYLTRPVPLATLRFGILLSRGSSIWTLERLEGKWVIICVVFLLANHSQTASWSSLITPMQIVVPTPLQGTEIDLTSDAFSKQFDQLWNGTSGIQDYIDSALWVLAMSGTVNANSQAGYDFSFIDFGGWTTGIPLVCTDSPRSAGKKPDRYGIYFLGGTFPINLPYLADPTLNTTAIITSNTEPFPPPGSDFNVSMSQQGFSAIASCQYQQLDAESDPPLERFVNSVEITSGGGVTTYTAVSVTTTALMDKSCSTGDAPKGSPKKVAPVQPPPNIHPVELEGDDEIDDLLLETLDSPINNLPKKSGSSSHSKPQTSAKQQDSKNGAANTSLPYSDSTTPCLVFCEGCGMQEAEGDDDPNEVQCKACGLWAHIACLASDVDWDDPEVDFICKRCRDNP